MANKILDEIVKKIEESPRLSATTSSLLAVIGDEKHSLSDVALIVENDEVLTALALKTVNSPAFGISKEVDSIDDAIKLLGDTVIAGLSLKNDKVCDADLTGYIAEDSENWAHSLRTAVAAKHFAKKFSNGVVPESVAYTAGIIHDVGKSVIASFLEEKSFRGIAIDNFEQAEKDFLGISHSEAGYLLAKSWGLPESLTEVIRFHHTPSSASSAYKQLVYVVHLADIMSMIAGTGTGIDTLKHPLDNNYQEYIQISKQELEFASIDIEQEFKKSYNAIAIAFNKA
jgi:putative nucleotidyltransferase with HDIG domain